MGEQSDRMLYEYFITDCWCWYFNTLNTCLKLCCCCCLVAHFLPPGGLQNTTPPCPSLSPGISSNSSTEPVMPSNHYILCGPLLLPSVFPNESALVIRWPKYWSFHFSISPSNELIYFRTDWFELLEAQVTLKSLLQHHSSKPSILWCSAFFIVQLSLLEKP